MAYGQNVPSCDPLREYLVSVIYAVHKLSSQIDKF